YGIKSLYFAETFDEALKHCTEIAKEGDAVLLSPACASWGMFENYEQRGDLFKEYVNQL
ncbi:MAG: UDP-N-acetylmuramoyl-L-alanine--D-glutamate ligase, partial [Lachnospiraceae bacterium]|nr:UDP-N-acetylmuramoyl-L-alanine--D-glutamate ligase [Lachnospiraceae bacterium]